MDLEEIWITEFTLEDAINYRQQILKKANQNPDLPIVLYINSYGGEAAALMTILDTLDSIPNEVITIVSGIAASCGAFLLMRGDNRYAGPNSDIMFHRASNKMIGTDKDHLENAKVSKRLTERLTKLITDNLAPKGSTVKDEENRQIIEKAMESNVDFNITAQEALDLGVIHKIGVPRLVEQKMFGLVGGMTEEDLPLIEEEPKIKPKKTKKKKK